MSELQNQEFIEFNKRILPELTGYIEFTTKSNTYLIKIDDDDDDDLSNECYTSFIYTISVMYYIIM